MVIILSIIAAFCAGYCTRALLAKYRCWRLWKRIEPEVRAQADLLREERRLMELLDAATADVKKRAERS